MSKKTMAAKRAIKQAGGPIELARKLMNGNATPRDLLRMQSRVSKWAANGVAARWVLSVESITGISRHELAPDLYPKDTTAAA